MDRPFIYGYLAEKDNFIDRQKERTQLKTFLSHGINVMLISPRRWGKSSLVKATMSEMTEEDHNVRVCYIDAFRIHSSQDFYNAYATAVINGLSSAFKKSIEWVKKYLQALTPSITLKSDPLNAIELDLSYQPLEKSAEEILQLPEKIAQSRGLHVIICIDEFQQLAKLPGWKKLEGLLRSVWQQHQSVNYCLYGSKRHMMLDIFENSSHPFYRFGQIMYIQKIDREYWIPYIQKGFSDYGKSISEIQAKRICDIVKCHSWYVQQLSFFVWSATIHSVTDPTIDQQIETLIDTNSPVFESETDALAPSQRAMLRALVNGEHHLNSQAVILKYGLGGSQTIVRNKKVLVEKDFIEICHDSYLFVDPVYELWLRREVGLPYLV